MTPTITLIELTPDIIKKALLKLKPGKEDEPSILQQKYPLPVFFATIEYQKDGKGHSKRLLKSNKVPQAPTKHCQEKKPVPGSQIVARG